MQFLSRASRVLRRRRLGGGDRQLLHPACHARQRRRHDDGQVPGPAAAGREGARGRVRRRPPGQPAAPVLGVSRQPRAPQPRDLGQPLSRQGHERARQHGSLDAGARRHGHDDQLRARHAARHLRRLAPRRLARPVAARRSRSCRRPRTSSWRCWRSSSSRSIWHIFPVSGGYTLGLTPGWNWPSSPARSTTRCCRR